MKNLLFFLFIFSVEIFSQNHNGLNVMPRHLHFYNNFERSKLVRVENNSNNVVTVDSITYNSAVYIVRLNDVNATPVNMQPWSSFTFEVIQYNYFNLVPEDSSAVINIYNSSNEPLIQIESHHHQQMGPSMKGVINGTVSDSSNVLTGAPVYFFYNRTLLIDSVKTGLDGSFEKELPVGEYFVAAEYDGYYLKYAYDEDSPLGADPVQVQHNAPITLDFVLEKESSTDLNLTGTIKDPNDVTLAKAVVVIRKGKHTPTKISSFAEDDINRSYTVISDNNGNYNLSNIKYPGDYYVQAFAPFNLPGYYNDENLPSVYWQESDSVDISNSLSNIDITLARDSSYGAGLVEGSVLSENQNDPVTDAIVYVRSADANQIYTYTFVTSEGNYSIPVLPYGEYELVAQKIGAPDSESGIFSINTTQDTIRNLNLSIILTSVKEENIPNSFELLQNYPNPFNPTTTIKFSIPDVGRSGTSPYNVRLTIFNTLGQQIATLVNETKSPGVYEVQFNAGGLSSGIYFYELKVGNYNSVKKMNLLK